MKAISILQEQLRDWCPAVDKTRLAALMTTVEALVTGQTLTVTGLGRHSPRDIKTKHAIKQADRLVGNPHLYAQRDDFYRALTHELLRHQPRPVILIDWSDCPDNRSFVLLRASVPVGGRSVTLFEEVHPISLLGNRKVQQQFLSALSTILPTGSRTRTGITFRGAELGQASIYWPATSCFHLVNAIFKRCLSLNA